MSTRDDTHVMLTLDFAFCEEQKISEKLRILSVCMLLIEIYIYIFYK